MSENKTTVQVFELIKSGFVTLREDGGGVSFGPKFRQYLNSVVVAEPRKILPSMSTTEYEYQGENVEITAARRAINEHSIETLFIGLKEKECLTEWKKFPGNNITRGLSFLDS
jgi:hypothetical protein